jgi:hypothetical protein
MPDNSNPYLTVGQPNYAAPLVNFAGDMNSGMQMGQNARSAMFGQQGQQGRTQQPQWPQAGQYRFPQGQNPTQQQVGQGQANPGQVQMQQGPQPGPAYAQNLAHLFGIGLPNQQGQQPGAQSPTQWGGNPSPYTNFDFPGT